MCDVSSPNPWQQSEGVFTLRRVLVDRTDVSNCTDHHLVRFNNEPTSLKLVRKYYCPYEEKPWVMFYTESELYYEGELVAGTVQYTSDWLSNVLYLT